MVKIMTRNFTSRSFKIKNPIIKTKTLILWLKTTIYINSKQIINKKKVPVTAMTKSQERRKNEL